MWTNLIAVCFCFTAVFEVAFCQTSNDPILKITHTSPPSRGIGGKVVYGHIADDAIFNCFAENLRDYHQVHWERYVSDSNGVQRQVHIATDMDTQDNMKWSIEKPTDSSWRLRVRSLRWDDQSNYTCYVPLNTYGNRIQDYKTMVIVDPPRIIQGETSYNQRVEEGNNINLQCKASGFPTPTVLWRRQGNMNLPTSAGGGVIRMGEDLTINNVRWNDQGLYICDVMNSFGEDRREVYLTVDFSPKVQPEAEQVGQAVGYQRTLACHVFANPQPNTNMGADGSTPQLAWMKQGETIAVVDDDRNTLRIIEGAYGRLTFELRISPVIPSDFGVYTCWAQNTRGFGTAEVELVELQEPVPDKGQINAAPAHRTPLQLLVCLLVFILLLIA